MVRRFDYMQLCTYAHIIAHPKSQPILSFQKGHVGTTADDSVSHLEFHILWVMYFMLYVNTLIKKVIQSVTIFSLDSALNL